MAYYDLVWYCNAGDQATTGYYAVAKWAATTAIAAGVLRRQLAAPAVGSERVFVCIVAGTTGSSEPAWTLTRGAKTTDGTVTWQECTGASAVNGDATNTQNWTAAKAIGSPTLGAIIKRNNGASYWICSVAGALGASEPAWPNDTAGTTQADNTTTWTCLGVVGNFTGGGAPHARLANVFGSSWYIAGNTVYVGDNHAESQSTAINIAPAGPGNASVIGRILCHNHSGNYPPGSSDLAAGATISSTSTSTLTINPSGPIYFYGLTFRSGVGTSTTGVMMTISGTNWSDTLYFDRCSLQSVATGATQIQFGNIAPSGSAYILNNTTVYFGNTSDYISILSTRFTWQNTVPILAAGSSVPAALFSLTNAFIGVFDATLEALDLSQLNGNLYSTPNASVVAKANFLVKDCKLNAAMAFATPAFPGCNIQYARSSA